MLSLKALAGYGGSLVAMGTLAAAVGYGWPWVTVAQGKTLEQAVDGIAKHLSTVDVTVYQLQKRDCQRDRDDAQAELAQDPHSRSAANALADAQDCISTYSRLIVKDQSTSP